MKKIAIMGAGGFLGRNITEFLQDRYTIYPVTRDDFSFLDENKVRTFLVKNNIDIIFNCANKGGSRKNGYQENDNIVTDNLRLFFNIERCLLPHMKLINFGSGAQYDKKQDLIKILEDKIGQNIPQDDYGYSKYVMSKYISKCSNIYNPIIFGLYGKYEDYTFKFISNAILKNILKMPIMIKQNVMFDYLYIDDFLNVMELLIENDYENKEFNITPNQSIDLVTAAEYINECSTYKSEILVKHPDLNYQYTGNNQKMMKNIGRYKFTSYKQGIAQLYQYYLEHLNCIDLETIRADKTLNYCKVRNK